MLKDNTSIKGVYAALEDYQPPKENPAVYEFPIRSNETRLRSFIALQEDALLILGPRRHPPIPARAANTNTSISIQTGLGFRTLESDDYVEAGRKLRPDIILGMADYEYLKKPGVKRIEKMGDRTLAWFHDMVAGHSDESHESPPVAIFAPVLPIEAERQSDYLNTLTEDLADRVSGWVIYDRTSMDAIPAPLHHLPKFALTNIPGPHELLDHISLGLDAFILPFIGEATDAGLALTFTFPGPEPLKTTPHPTLALDMWSTTYITDTTPMVENCTCYACKTHHRAFIHHLLDAREMLAWVLLQIHNHHTMDNFFSNIRHSIRRGTFNTDCDIFNKSFEREFPVNAGKGPRLRGYQVKSGPSQPRRNPQAFRSLEDAQEKLVEAPLLPSSDADGDDLERRGFAEKVT
ncbi:MAG: hypothetical protein Q9172_003298 [Xanthocarpia lactea]